MNTNGQEPTLINMQMEMACGGAYVNNRLPDGRWEFPVIDLDGNTVAIYSDVVEAMDHCMYNHLDSTPIGWDEVERRKREAQYRREHVLPARTMYETVYDIWLCPQ